MPRRPVRRADPVADSEKITGWHDDPSCPQAAVDRPPGDNAAHNHWHSDYDGPPRTFVPRPSRQPVLER